MFSIFIVTLSFWSAMYTFYIPDLITVEIQLSACPLL